MRNRNEVYADAFAEVILAEGSVNEVRDELISFSQALEANDELRNALGDPHIPAERRQQIVQDLLGGKASDVTTALVSLVVGTGRIRELPGIVDSLKAKSASLTDRDLAEVRSAVALTDEQKVNLAGALRQSQGKDFDIVNIVDPSLLGGIVVQIGDTVIDGSVRNRLAQLRESF